MIVFCGRPDPPAPPDEETPLPLAWYVVQTHPRAEAAVSEHLLDQEFEVFNPEYLKAVIHGRHKRRVAAPLFPCYTFVRFAAADPQRWKPINRTLGVVRILATAEESPVAVPDALMGELLNSVGATGYLDVTDETAPIRYRPGQFLRVVGGSLQGFVGLCLGSDGQRVGVLLEILGGAREVKIPDDQVTLAEPVEPPRPAPRRHRYTRPRRAAGKETA